MSLFTPHNDLFTAIFSYVRTSDRASRASRPQRLHSGADAPARTPTAGTLQMLRNRGNEVVLLGHSMGCRVVLHSLLDWPGPPGREGAFHVPPSRAPTTLL